MCESSNALSYHPNYDLNTFTAPVQSQELGLDDDSQNKLVPLLKL